MDEDFDFTAPSRSRLSSLFQGETTTGDVNQALTFTAPKQPKKNDNTQGASGTLKLIHAAAVHTYKLKDGNYTNQGKLGCAVLGHHETSTYKLLLYKGKQIQVNIVSITPNFLFHVQPNNYANFYDEKKENWSINFDSEAALFDFTKQVSLAKANSQGKCVTTLVIQDLVKGEGQPLENGDSAEVKYTGWLLSNSAFGQVFDSNMNSDSLFRVRLGKGKVIKGWNEGILGMQKGGKRFLIIPSNLAYGSEGIGSTVPPNSTLIFEIHVVKIKFARESSHSPSPVKAADGATDKKPEVPPRQSFSQEDNIRLRGASISEQLSQSPKRDKAHLISRMAKMGTATLPFQGAIPAQVSSDSESEVDAPQPTSPAPSISRTSSPKAFSKSRSRTNSGPVISSPPIQLQSVQDAIPFHASQPSNHISLYAQSPMSSHQPFVCAATPFPSYPNPMQGQFSVPQSPYSVQNVAGMIPSVPTSIADSHFNLIITETRSQNTEIRMGLSKITDKVDTVLQKVDDLSFQGKGVNTNLPFMENAVILQNIERIIQENTRLKEDIEAKGSKIQSLNEIICDLFQRNPRFSEESSGILERKNESLQMASAQSQEKISSLEEEKSKLQLELSTATSKLHALEGDVLKYQKLEIELNQKLLDEQKESKQQRELLNNTKEKINDNQTLMGSLQEKLKTVEHEKDLLNMKLQSIEEQHTKAQGSSDLVEIYKKEIKEYKEKIEELNSVIKDSVSSAKLEEEKDKIKVELVENIKLKEETESKVKEMEKKIKFYEELKLSYEDKIRKLEHEVEYSQLLKKKLEVFQEKTRTLKETYERQIEELVNEARHLQSMKSETSPEFSVEIKKVMNRLYKLLQAKFEADTSYPGSTVLETVLKAIMGLTLHILENKKHSSGDIHSDTTVSSEKDVSKKQEVQNLKETQQNMFNQQNGVCDSKTELAVVSDALDTNSDLSNVEQASDTSKVQLETVKEVKGTVPTEKEENDTNVNNEVAGSTECNDESQVKQIECAQVGETDRRESPEIWRPQPPPLFDDDDDDEDDDDWLK